MRKNEKIKNFVKRVLFGTAIGLILLAILLSIPYIFDFFYGEDIVNKTLNNVVGNLTDLDKIGLAIMEWESKYFYNPYSLWNPNSTLQRYRIYEVNGTYMWFVRDAPVSWIIFSRLANCGEYAKVFVYLMRKKGINARLVHAPGEDHAWAEYYSDGYKIVVDPSTNKVISNKRNFAKGKNWSYIESVDIFNISDKKDISNEYIDRGILIVKVFDNQNLVKGINVVVKSPYLMKINPKRYKKPKIVLIKNTNKTGEAVFKLGEKEYMIEIKKTYLIFDIIYSKNVTVMIDKRTSLVFNLDKDNYEIKFFNLFD